MYGHGYGCLQKQSFQFLRIEIDGFVPGYVHQFRRSIVKYII